MQQVAACDPDAQRRLMERFVARVRRRCRLLLRDDSDVDDAAQMALLEVLRSAAGFGQPGNLEAWVDKIAARTALRHIHRLRAQRSLATRVAEAMQLPRWLDTRERPFLTGQLESYLDRLPPERRDVVDIHQRQSL